MLNDEILVTTNSLFNPPIVRYKKVLYMMINVNVYKKNLKTQEYSYTNL